MTQDNDELVWEDPPPLKVMFPPIWMDRLLPVMTKPGTWARVLECEGTRRAETYVSNLRQGRLACPPGIWEFASRSNKEQNKCWVYAKWVGPSEEAANPESFEREFGPGTGDGRNSDGQDRALRQEVSDSQDDEESREELEAHTG